MTTIRRTRLAAAALVLAAAGTTAGATAASAIQPGYGTLKPGRELCVTQYASSKVRVDGTATGQGARFRLSYYGGKIDDTWGRVNAVAFERRSAWGTFPGTGYYTACATNTGQSDTTVTLTLRTDAEVS